MDTNLYVDFLLYSLTGFAIMIVGLLLFELTTKNKEFALIFKGNASAALSLGGRLAGLAIVIRAAAENAVSLSDMLLWGVIGIVALVILYYLTELITYLFGKGLKVNVTIFKAIEQNNIAVGILILLISCSVGMIIAGCLTYNPDLLG
jgi:Predicted membrane protein